MASKQPQHDKEFKLNAVKYLEEHPDLTLRQCAKNLGIGASTLTHWNSSSEPMTGIYLSEVLATMHLMTRRR